MRQLLRFVPVLALLPFIACNCDPLPVDPPPQQLEGTCTRLAGADDRRCNRDDQCGCGTHCDLGRCVATCATTADCGDGESCDDFGRCVPSDAVNRIRLPALGGQGRAVLRQSQFERNAVGFYALDILASGGPLASARVAPGLALEVALAQPGVADFQLPFAPELLLENLAAESVTTVILRERASTQAVGDPAFLAGIEVFDSAGGQAFASVSGRPFEEVEPAGEVEGVYRGLARISHRGASVIGSLGLPTDVRTTTPLTLRVFPRDGQVSRIEIEDPARLLVPEGRWVGDVDFASGVVDLPSLEIVPALSVAGAPLHVVATATATLRNDPLSAEWDGTLTLALEQRMQGVTGSVLDTPFIAWELFFDKVAELDTFSAPARAGDAQLAYDPLLVANEPFPLESIYIEAVSPQGLAGADLQEYANAWQIPGTTAGVRPGAAFSGGQPEHLLTQVTMAVRMGNANLQDAPRLARPTLAELQSAAGTTISPSLEQWLGSFSEVEPGQRGGTTIQHELLFFAEAFPNPFIVGGNLFDFGRPRLSSPLPLPTAYPADRFFLDGRSSRPIVPCAFEDPNPARKVSTVTNGGLTCTGTGQANALCVESLTAGESGEFLYRPNGTRVDFCDLLEARWQCESVDLQTQPEALRTFPVTLSKTVFSELQPDLEERGRGSTRNHRDVLSVNVVATRGCEARPVSTNATSAIICDNQDGASFAADVFDPNNADPATGDPRCTDSGKSLALPADVPGVAAGDLIQRCIDDFEALGLNPGVVLDPGAPVSAQLDSVGWNASEACLNPIQFLTKLGALSDELRRVTLLVNETPGALSEAATARLLQRWLQVHTLVASESLEQADLLPGVENRSGRQALEDALERTNLAWQLLLQPRVASALAGLSGDALAAVDVYDPLRATPIVGLPTWTTGHGLLVAAEELVEVQAGLIQRLVDLELRAGARETTPAIAEAKRLQLIAGALLSELEQRATVAGGGPPGGDRLVVARKRAIDAAARAELLVAAAREGTNPLGIEDVDLPLYFSQVATDAGSRFTAVSNYLIGTDFSDRAPVASLVRDAVESFAAARTSFLAEAQRLVNVENTQSDRDDAVRTERVELGSQILDLCGQDSFPGLDAIAVATGLEDGSLDASGCWFDREQATCTPPPTPTPDPVRRLKEVRDSAYLAACVASFETQPEPVVVAAVGVGGGLAVIARDDRIFAPMVRGETSFPVQMLAAPLLREMYDEARSTWSGLPAAQPAALIAPAIPPPFQRPYLRRLGSLTFNLIPTGEFVALNGTVFGNLVPIPGFVVDGGQVRSLTQNLCENPDAPDFPGFLPQLIFPNDDAGAAPVLRCVPRAPFSGPTIERAFDPGAMLVRAGAGNAGTTLSLRRARATAAAFCAERFPPPGAPNGLLDPQPQASCYRGALGQEAFALRNLATDVGVAREEAASLIREYDIQIESCSILRAANVEREGLERAHVETMNSMQQLRADYEQVALIADATAACADSVNSSLGAIDESSGVSLAIAATACAGQAISAGVRAAGARLEADMENAQRNHDLAVLQIDSGAEEDRCFAEAEIALVGLEAARLRVLRAVDELSLGYLKFESATEQLGLAVDRGVGSIVAAQNSLASLPGRDPWLNDDVTAFRKKLALARRAAYLGVRAVEYEFQQSLAARAAVLQAEKANDLVDVLDELRGITVTGSINGAQPAELTQVISLRQHLLQIADQTGVDPGNQELSEVERFRQVMLDPRFQVTEGGQLQGIQIPFQIAPLRELQRGEFVGVPIVADNSCGERIYAINASIVGDPARLFEGVNEQVDLEIRQSNTFYANTCVASPTEPFQVASTRPHRNLFRVPGVGEGVTDLVSSEAQQFAKARVQARLNVSGTDLASEAFVDGESTELAARLLFGEYALFIPATALPQVNERGEAEGDGLRLNEVDDILLRIDYLSVAR